MTVAYLEIYNNKIRDLLKPSDEVHKVYVDKGEVKITSLKVGL